MENHRPRFLFLSMPFSGIEVWFRKMQRVVADREDIEALWEFVDFEPEERIARLPLISKSWIFKAGVIARSRIAEHVRRSGALDGILLNHILPLSFLGSRLKTVPTFLSLDSTPALMQTMEGWDLVVRPPGSPVSRIRTLMLRRLYRQCATIFPWSRYVGESLERDYGLPSEKLTVIPPGVDTNAWHPPAERNSHDGKTILFVGRGFDRKGGTLLLELSRLPEFSSYTFKFVTEESAGVSGGNVQFLSGLRPNSDDLIQLYAQADIFAFPTKADFAPTNVVCEAMSMELPVIVTDRGGLGEYVIDGQTGYVIQPDDKATLAARLHQLASSPDLRRSMGRKGRERAMAHLHLTANTNRILDEMKRVVDDRKGR